MLPYKNFQDKLEKIKNGELSLKENVAYFLNEIEKNKHLNAFNSVFTDEAIEQAVKVEGKIKSGKHGKLAGLVLAVKDVLSIKDKPLNMLIKYIKRFYRALQCNSSSEIN